MFHRLYS